jgi:hypothetical protein
MTHILIHFDNSGGIISLERKWQALSKTPDKYILCPSRLEDGREAAIPQTLLKTQLSSNPVNGEAMARKRAEAPNKIKTMTMMMEKLKK